jgi:benzodiazapine receptor
VRILKIKWKALIISIVIPLAVGGLSALFTQSGMKDFGTVKQPAFAPPGSLFPIVWSILFVLMGIASYLIYTSQASSEQIQRALILYGIQLVVNFFWSIIFFNMQAFLFSFVWLLILWLLILTTMVMFYRIRKSAMYLLIPYILWVTFAVYLNFGVYRLN